jgi:NADH-quinone oxidoreductase subunit L
VVAVRGDGHRLPDRDVCLHREPRFPAAFVEQFGFLYRFLLNKWYFDELYHFIFVRPALWLGRVFWKVGDIGIIDRFGPNGAAWLVAQGSRGAVKLQSGYLYSYALVMLVGLVGAISWVIAQ